MLLQPHLCWQVSGSVQGLTPPGPHTCCCCSTNSNVMFAFIKHLWYTGEREQAFSRLSDLVAEVGGEGGGGGRGAPRWTLVKPRLLLQSCIRGLGSQHSMLGATAHTCGFSGGQPPAPLHALPSAAGGQPGPAAPVVCEARPVGPQPGPHRGRAAAQEVAGQVQGQPAGARVTAPGHVDLDAERLAVGAADDCHHHAAAAGGCLPHKA